MTTEQAIKILNGAIKKPNTKDGYLGQALTMAINALKNQPEIIRCKDCEYSSPNRVYGCRLEPFDFNEKVGRMYSNDHCSKAILRGEQDESIITT